MATALTPTTRRSSAASRASTACPCMVLGHQKGRDTKEKIHRNFGMPRPEGYRKALRAHEARREIRPAALHVRRHAGRVSGHRRRGARPVRGHRPQSVRDVRPARPDHRDGDRRRRLRRCARHRRRRRHVHAAVRDVLRHLAGGLRVDPVEVRRAGAGGRGNPRHHRAEIEAAGPHRQGRSASRSAAPIATTRR